MGEQKAVNNIERHTLHSSRRIVRSISQGELGMQDFCHVWEKLRSV
jgi:hypothetical protein